MTVEGMAVGYFVGAVVVTIVAIAWTEVKRRRGGAA